jgi:NAD(P)-dependent dehydrogenase (short-subunit alcohol dehydrogenase family)
MQIAGSVALVTGANRGLGRAFARELVERGAAKTYAAARDPSAVTDPGLTPIALDVTDPESVSAAAAACTDVTLLINNAGILVEGLPVSSPLDDARLQLEVNYLGTLAMSQAFAPILVSNGGGALVNVLSVLSLVTNPRSSTYAASKAADWSITNALRVELRSHGTQVVGVFCAYIDTDMAAAVEAAKVAPAEVAARTLDGIVAGQEEIFVDTTSRYVKDNLARDLELIYPGIQQQHDAAVASAETHGATR